MMLVGMETGEEADAGLERQPGGRLVAQFQSRQNLAYISSDAGSTIYIYFNDLNSLLSYSYYYYY